VTVPAAQVAHMIPADIQAQEPARVTTGALTVRYEINGNTTEKHFNLNQGMRLSIGRTKENNVAIDHTSVSKLHASLLLNKDGKLVVADTGSTNGTYLNDERIAYGKAIEIFPGDRVKFGAIDVQLEFNPTGGGSDEPPPTLSSTPTVAYSGEFPKRTEVIKPAVKSAESEDAEKNL
jgi:pSer/pThr/pTyr-binding forkhead associated (FHA) protein